MWEQDHQRTVIESITYTSVDDRNLDTPTNNALIPKPIDLRHNMRRKRIRRLLAGLDWLPIRLLCSGILSRRPVDLVRGHIVSSQWPHLAVLSSQ